MLLTASGLLFELLMVLELLLSAELLLLSVLRLLLELGLLLSELPVGLESLLLFGLGRSLLSLQQPLMRSTRKSTLVPPVDSPACIVPDGLRV